MKTKRLSAPRSWEMYTVLDSQYRYWDERIGACAYPDVYVNSESATAHARKIEERWGVRCKVVVVSVHYPNRLPTSSK